MVASIRLSAVKVICTSSRPSSDLLTVGWECLRGGSDLFCQVDGLPVVVVVSHLDACLVEMHDRLPPQWCRPAREASRGAYRSSSATGRRGSDLGLLEGPVRCYRKADRLLGR